jgi:hypothetical protein
VCSFVRLVRPWLRLRLRRGAAAAAEADADAGADGDGVGPIPTRHTPRSLTTYPTLTHHIPHRL